MIEGERADATGGIGEGYGYVHIPRTCTMYPYQV